MATRRAVANGNWSSTSTWNGGVVPTDGDTVYANGFNITLDVDVNIGGANNPIVNTGSLVSGQWYEIVNVGGQGWTGIGAASNTTGTVFQSTGTGTAGNLGTARALATLTTATNTAAGATTGGGVFTMSTIRAMTADLRAGTTTCLNVAATSGTLTLSQIRAVGGSSGAFTISNTSAASLNIQNCTFTGGAGGGAPYLLNNASSGSISATGSTFTASGGGIANNASTGSILFQTGTLSTTATNGFALNNASTGTIIVENSTLTAGAQASCFVLNNNSTGTCTITNCSVRAGQSATSQAVNNVSTGSIVATGSTFTASAFATAVTIANTAADVRLSGDFLDHWSGWKAVNGGRWRLGTAPTLGQTRYALAGTTDSYFTMFGSDFGSFGNPIAANVRSGVVYAGGNLTGTCAVPSPSSTAFGVPVDNTTGTAVLTPAAIRAELATELGRIDAAISSRLAPSGTLATVTTLTNAPASVTASDIWSYATRTITGGTVDTLTNAPTVPSASAIASQVRTELSVELGRVDQNISSRLAAADYTAPSAAPSVVDIRTELDANSTKLANLDANISSRLADADYVAPTTPPTAADIAAAVEGSLLNEADGQAVLNALVGAIGNTNLSEVSLVAAVRADLERSGGKLDSIPTTAAPSASAVASATRTELSTELSRIDQAISSRLASASYVAPTTPPTVVEIRQEIDANSTKLDASVSTRLASTAATDLAAVKAKTDLLNTERLANVPTVNILGTLLAQANS